jgi:hypothetical protein
MDALSSDRGGVLVGDDGSTRARLGITDRDRDHDRDHDHDHDHDRDHDDRDHDDRDHDDRDHDDCDHDDRNHDDRDHDDRDYDDDRDHDHARHDRDTATRLPFCPCSFCAPPERLLPCAARSSLHSSRSPVRRGTIPTPSVRSCAHTSPTGATRSSTRSWSTASRTAIGATTCSTGSGRSRTISCVIRAAIGTGSPSGSTT